MKAAESEITAARSEVEVDAARPSIARRTSAAAP